MGRAKAAIITISDQDETNRAVISLRRQFPDLKIFARAKDINHQMRLQKTLDVIALVPFLPEDSVLLTLPFGGAVLKSLGAPVEEVYHNAASTTIFYFLGLKLLEISASDTCVFY